MKRKTFYIITAFIVLLVSFFAWKVFGPEVNAPEGKFFYIKTGAGFSEVGNDLVSQKIIPSVSWYHRLASAMKFKTVKAGKYEIKDKMSLYQLVRMLKNGRQIPVNFVITKLRTKEDFARRCGNLFEFDSLLAIHFFNSNDSLAPYGLDSNTVMAAVMPDTYTYFWNTTPKKIFLKLYDYWQQFWTEERKQKAAAKGLTPVQVSTLASIIDEESNFAPEKDTIASVYLNRIKKGMPLQADPTVKFALKDFSIKRIYEKHLAVESPYNTYRNAGLPPGPICTALPETIDAVLNAPETDYLYFVAKDDFSGRHEFTTGYKEHLTKAREYQKALNRQDSIRHAGK